VGKIAILLSTYNGEKYLKALLESLFLQTYKDFVIIVRDDGSSDNTLNILKNYLSTGKIYLLEDNNNYGIKKSFEILLKTALKENIDYFMFCDQDDVWKMNKVEISFQKIKYKKTPFLLHTDLEVVDKNLRVIDDSFWHYQSINPMKNKLNNMLMQNTVTGCSMIINRPLAEKIVTIPNESIMHDWWISLVASAFGKIEYVNYSSILYRQHSQNNVGATKFDIHFIFKKLFSNSLNNLFRQAAVFYNTYFYDFSLNQKILLEEFIDLPNKNFLEKRKTLLKYDFFKHGIIRNIGLMIKI